MINKTKLKIVDVVKVSPKCQVVIPKDIRKSFNIVPGERLIVMTRDKAILFKKLTKLSIEEISGKMEEATRKKGINVDKLVAEAVRWARKSK
jgi:AbrB family looped-hinge helix DNA binding protein